MYGWGRDEGINRYAPYWGANAGLLEASSAKHPFNQPHRDFDSAQIEPGVWQIMPETSGDHGVAIGMKVPKEQTQAFYLRMVQMLAGTE